VVVVGVGQLDPVALAAGGAADAVDGAGEQVVLVIGEGVGGVEPAHGAAPAVVEGLGLGVAGDGVVALVAVFDGAVHEIKVGFAVADFEQARQAVHLAVGGFVDGGIQVVEVFGFVADVADGLGGAVGGIVLEGGFDAVVVGAFRDAAILVEQADAGAPAVADVHAGHVLGQGLGLEGAVQLIEEVAIVVQQ